MISALAINLSRPWNLISAVFTGRDTETPSCPERASLIFAAKASALAAFSSSGIFMMKAPVILVRVLTLAVVIPTSYGSSNIGHGGGVLTLRAGEHDRHRTEGPTLGGLFDPLVWGWRSGGGLRRGCLGPPSLLSLGLAADDLGPCFLVSAGYIALHRDRSPCFLSLVAPSAPPSAGRGRRFPLLGRGGAAFLFLGWGWTPRFPVPGLPFLRRAVGTGMGPFSFPFFEEGALLFGPFWEPASWSLRPAKALRTSPL